EAGLARTRGGGALGLEGGVPKLARKLGLVDEVLARALAGALIAVAHRKLALWGDAEVQRAGQAGPVWRLALQVAKRLSEKRSAGEDAAATALHLNQSGVHLFELRKILRPKEHIVGALALDDLAGILVHLEGNERHPEVALLRKLHHGRQLLQIGARHHAVDV